MFCYADDLIPTRLTYTGLQSLINVSRDYITAHGLNFNSSKTTCTTFGTTHQEVKPTWNLNEVNVKKDDAVTYLGTRLSNQTRDHIDSRITAARRAFYGLQSAGLCAGRVNPFTIAHTVGAKEIFTLLKRRKKITAKQGIKFHIPLSLLSVGRV